MVRVRAPAFARTDQLRNEQSIRMNTDMAIHSHMSTATMMDHTHLTPTLTLRIPQR